MHPVYAQICLIAASLLLFMSLFLLLVIGCLGRKYRESRLIREPVDERAWLVYRHKQLIWWWAGMTSLVVVFAEGALWLSGRTYAPTPLLVVHFSADVLLLILVTLAVRWNGQKHQPFHRPIVYALITDYLVVAVTGALQIHLLWMLVTDS